MQRVMLFAICAVGACGGDGKPSTKDAADITDAAPAIDAAPSGRASADDAARACVVLGSHDGQGPTECFDDYIAALRADEIACLVAARTDRTAAFACLGFGIDSPMCPAACDGNTLTCFGPMQVDLACDRSPYAEGPTCLQGSGGAQCGAGACSATERSCRDTWEVTCDTTAGVLEGRDCARFGWACSNGFCTDGTTPPAGCNGDRCDGTRLVDCVGGSGNYELAIDCARNVDGMTCNTIDGDSECGLVGAACDSRSERRRETCSGTTIQFCAGHASAAVDCTTLGFAGCQPGTGTVAGRCTP